MTDNPEIQQNQAILSQFQQQQQQQQQHLRQQQLIQLQQEQKIKQFWDEIRIEMENLKDLKNHQLPLARIKKIMKSDEDVKMISAEVLDLFSKACEIFLRELTLRAWLNTDENKRKTLQKNDIAMAVAKTDIYDFLIDIVPRDEIKTHKRSNFLPTTNTLALTNSALLTTPVAGEDILRLAQCLPLETPYFPTLSFQGPPQQQQPQLQTQHNRGNAAPPTTESSIPHSSGTADSTQVHPQSPAHRHTHSGPRVLL
jgi:histone H3/H4